ncbi:DUF262 domain-containing protein [Phocaeicola massiliensis]|uniref:DUF262 domain-containing protein n=1 Tax=Phocaeicola massiliensis TaxID=204516 RepID=UPI003569ABF9
MEIQENNFIEEDDTMSTLPPMDVIAFNELRSTSDIVRLYTTKQLIIQPDFQRGIVWSNKDQSIFIDSLLKQLPIPSLCISLDIHTNKRLVIDGLQRISSIIKFLTDEDWKLSKTDTIDERISGKKVSEIRNNDSQIIEIIENVVIPVTIIRCDYKNSSHMRYLYQIFQRLNSGGTRLLPQEIRNCIYNGNFNTKLKEIVRTQEWLSIRDKTIEDINNNRFSNEELLLRFYAFYYSLDNYTGRLSDFLNNFMFINKDLDESTLAEYVTLITDTLNLIINKVDNINRICKLKKTILEGLLIGVAKNLSTLQHVNKTEFEKLFSKFEELPEYSLEELSEGLSSREKVINRITSAINVFRK